MPPKKGQSPEHYKLVPDMDPVILSVLPDEGRKMGIRVLAPQVKGIVARVNSAYGEGSVRATTVLGRMRALTENGLAVGVTVTPLAGGRGYQRTEAGKKWMHEQGFDDKDQEVEHGS